MPPVRFSSLLMLVIAAAAVTIAIAYGLRGSIGLPGGLLLFAAVAVALRLALWKRP